MKLLIYSFLFLLFACKTKQNTPLRFEGKVIGVKDGDTFEVLFDGKGQTIRLEHVDCPEKKQPYGMAAKKFASDLCFGNIVRVENKGTRDRYKRLIATIFINNICINKELVKAGFAWHFKKYSTDTDYDELEEQARQNKVGLWADSTQIPPWEWRHPK